MICYDNDIHFSKIAEMERDNQRKRIRGSLAVSVCVYVCTRTVEQYNFRIKKKEQLLAYAIHSN